MPNPKMGRREFSAAEVKSALDSLNDMVECAVEREDKADEKALRIAHTATRILLGDGKYDTSVPWPKEG